MSCIRLLRYAGSEGTMEVYRGQCHCIVEVKRIEGRVFNSKEAAEQHGIQLCKEWIDKRP